MKSEADYIRENATKECAFLAELIEADDPERYGDIARLAGTIRTRYEYLASEYRFGLSSTRSEKRENGLGRGETDLDDATGQGRR